jgi:hypothetical protein
MIRGSSLIFRTSMIPRTFRLAAQFTSPGRGSGGDELIAGWKALE